MEILLQMFLLVFLLYHLQLFLFSVLPLLTYQRICDCFPGFVQFELVVARLLFHIKLALRYSFDWLLSRKSKSLLVKLVLLVVPF